ncbi:hypothetical protein DCW30_28855 [Streptomyces alfalfae]|uniref:Secreted protein n=1 Tax=Streptomyces alfalfae TaxID=1642299 RepID=A0ABM6GSC3_9ACTN|nr:hypothetical protein [Streptomyces alfalfae]AYA17137.1 hypothetical protein D3X13_13580 [Streptomyces fradiae]APY86749.1 hypothetical protein A7J05_14330 [Streptomyces alfalfae]QUI33483.1 hypothetical protein H9W91_23425 [Streptomyces alfalfae]RXX37861.1 hypothetical protein DCW30_28855 [Streptomyces alfalfae]RZM83264.1 hypothetical protein D4104_34200 [Streptomyces alfalfae]
MRIVATSTFLMAAALTVVCSSTAAYAIGDKGDQAPPGPSGPSGGAKGNTLMAGVSQSSIEVTQVSGGKGGSSNKPVVPVDPNWKPPACWYEPVATSEQVKAAVDQLKKTPNENLVPVTPSLYWGQQLMVDHYEKGKTQSDGAEGYKNFNIGKKGKFWRGVVNPDMRDDPEAYDCEKNLFWQDAGTVPKIDHAPTPEVLASYAYNQIKVPETEVEMKPEGKSTVNLPTWVWLDKGKFEPVKVRAELPHTNLYAETTAKPVSLHLDPGTADAETFPADGECAVNEDGSIGAPYTKGSSKEDPPCGITYLRATGGEPYRLKASITWEITWEGTGGAGGDLPNGTFEGTQDVDVQEIQSINR